MKMGVTSNVMVHKVNFIKICLLSKKLLQGQTHTHRCEILLALLPLRNEESRLTSSTPKLLYSLSENTDVCNNFNVDSHTEFC